MSSAGVMMLALLWPLLAALLIPLAGRWPNLRETVTMVSASAMAVTVLSLWPGVLAGEYPRLPVMEVMPGITLAFSVEPLGMLFSALASSLWVINSLYSIGYMRGKREDHQSRFYCCFAISLFAVLGIAWADNLFTLFLFYEILTLSTLPLVAHHGDRDTLASARVYLGVLLFTSIGLLLPAIVWVWHLAGTTEFTRGGILRDTGIGGPALMILLALFVFGTGKAAVMPVHRWLPAAMVAPTPVSALLHAVAVVKAGVFTITKVIIYIFGVDFLFEEQGARWLVYVAGWTVVVASLVALRQDNLKRLLAYSTIGQLSFVVLAAAVLQPQSQIGAAVHIVAHAFGKITLFFAAGSIYLMSGRTRISELGGLGRRMPWTAAAFSVGALSMIGIPPTAGFVSKWFMLAGAFEATDYFVIFTIVASTVLNALYFLPIVFLLWLAPDQDKAIAEVREAPWTVVLALAATALLTLAFFGFNGPVLALESLLLERAA